MLQKYKIAVLLILMGMALPALAMDNKAFAAGFARAIARDGGKKKTQAARNRAKKAAARKKQAGGENPAVQDGGEPAAQADASGEKKPQTLMGALENAAEWAKTPGGGARGIFDLNGQVVETNDPFGYMTSPEGRAQIKKSFASKRAKAIAEGKDPSTCKMNVPAGDGIAVSMNEQDFTRYLDYIERLRQQAAAQADFGDGGEAPAMQDGGEPAAGAEHWRPIGFMDRDGVPHVMAARSNAGVQAGAEQDMHPFLANQLGGLQRAVERRNRAIAELRAQREADKRELEELRAAAEPESQPAAQEPFFERRPEDLWIGDVHVPANSIKVFPLARD
jgi:hypothetical protein